MHSSTRPVRMRTVTRAHRLRTQSNAPAVPRIVEHDPRPGDIHPVTRAMLLRLLPSLPKPLLRNISSIELRARVSPEVGNPYGTYSPRDAMIRLFSVPFPDWPCKLEVLRPQSGLASCGATLIAREGQSFIHWNRTLDVARFYFAVVLAHELGHHYVYLNRRRRQLPETMRGHEQRASRLMWRIGALAAFKREFGNGDA